MNQTAPDLFTNVHKGIRQALFSACLALGRCGDDPKRQDTTRTRLREALRFVAHHGENEDLLLLPLLAQHTPEIFQRIHAAHVRVQAALDALTAALDTATTTILYAQTCSFIALYLEHMHEEEHALEPAIRRALSIEQLGEFGRRSVERTAPADQRMMLSWMLPAMTESDAAKFLDRLPPSLAEELRPLSTQNNATL